MERLNRYSSSLVLRCCHCSLGWPPFLWVKLRKKWILTHHATQYHRLVHLSKCYKCTFSKSVTPEHFFFSILEDTLLFTGWVLFPRNKFNWLYKICRVSVYMCSLFSPDSGCDKWTLWARVLWASLPGGFKPYRLPLTHTRPTSPCCLPHRPACALAGRYVLPDTAPLQLLHLSVFSLLL